MPAFGPPPAMPAQSPLTQEEAPKPKKGKGGILGGLAKVGGAVLGALDMGRAAVVAGASEGGTAIHDLLRDDDEHASIANLRHNFNRRIGVGDILEETEQTKHLPLNVKRVLGGVGDIATDPLNAVTFGSGMVTKTGLMKVGQVIGDDVAKQALREGGVAGLREAIGKVSNESLEDILKRGTADLGKVTSEEAVGKTVADMAKNAKGGLGFNGLRTGLGQTTADRFVAAAKGSELGQAVRPLFNPTAKIADQFGQGAAGAVDTAISSGAQARREAGRSAAQKYVGMLDEEGMRALQSTPRGERLRFIRDVADGVGTAKSEMAGGKALTGVYDAEVKRGVMKAVSDDLLDSAPELLSEAPKPNFVPMGNGMFMHEAVRDALDGAVSASPSDLVKGIDAATNTLKRYTTLGPLNAIPHVSRNIFSNMLFATMYGGVKSPALWEESGRARSAMTKILKAGDEVGLDTLAEHGIEGKAAQRALAIHQQGLVGRGGVLFDDIGEIAPDVAPKLLKKEPGKLRAAAQKVSGEEGNVGTRTASRVNGWHEELSRGAVFLQGLDDGLSPAMAAQKSRRAMLDYSQEGLTKFEREKLQRLVFFYKFPRRAVPAGIKFAIEHPGATAVSSRAGLGVATGERNDFGEAIGPYFDTPLESAFGTISDFVKSPGDAAAQVVQPALQAALDPKKRTIRDLLPPLDQAANRLEAIDSDIPLFANPIDRTGTSKGKLVGPGGGLLGPSLIPGGQVGVDYEASEGDETQVKFEEGLQSRLAKGQKPTLKQRLTSLAVEAGIEAPYSKNQADLLSALKASGVKQSDLLSAISGPATIRKAPPHL